MKVALVLMLMWCFETPFVLKEPKEETTKEDVRNCFHHSGVMSIAVAAGVVVVEMLQ
jgi:hypothetical protein